MRRIFYREGDEIKLDFGAMILFALEIGIKESELREVVWSDSKRNRVYIN